MNQRQEQSRHREGMGAIHPDPGMGSIHREAFEEYEREMRERTIPAIQDSLFRRAVLAAESRRRIIKI